MPAKKVATERNPTIAAAFSGAYRYADKADAIARIEQLRREFKCSAKIAPTRENAIVMWIRGFGEPDEKKGFLGHFAELYVSSHPPDQWTILSEKIEAPLSTHEQRGRLYSPDGYRKPHPNWGHKLLRNLDKDSYATRELAWAELEKLHGEYPLTSIPQPLSGILNFMVFEASKDGGRGGSTRKMVLFLDERVDGRFRLGIRENVAKRLRAAEPAQSAMTPDEMIDLQKHAISFLGLSRNEDAILQSNFDVPFSITSPFVDTVRRIARFSQKNPQENALNPEHLQIGPASRASSLTMKTLFGIIGQSYERREGRTLYHYTRPAGLRGILQNGYLRLNDVSDMNDPTDISYGADRVFSTLKALNVDSKSDPILLSLTNKLEESLRGRSNASKYIFFSSFSEEIDTLEMWREYAMAGEGYALSLNRRNMMLKSPPNTLLAKVVYHEGRVEELLEIYRETIRNFSKCLSQELTTTNEDTHLPEELIKFSWAIAAMIKHRAYRNEKEWRLLRLIHSGEDRRDIVIEDRDHGLKPHIRGPQVAEQVLTGVFVGSAFDGHQDELVELLLEQNGFSDCAVTRSDVPLRRRRS